MPDRLGRLPGQFCAAGDRMATHAAKMQIVVMLLLVLVTFVRRRHNQLRVIAVRGDGQLMATTVALYRMLLIVSMIM